MERQKADVIFKMNLTFDRKFAINQTSFKKYLEDYINGLNIKSFPTFVNNKGRYIIEVVSNIDQVLVLDQDQRKEKKVYAGNVNEIHENLLTDLKVLGTQFKIQKIKSDAILKLYNSIIEEAEIAREQVKKRDNSPKRAIFSNEMELETLKKIIQNLNNELKDLEKENIELKQQLSDEKESGQFGDDILLLQIKNLEEKLKKSEEMYKYNNIETEEKIKLLQLEIIEKSDRIQELESNRCSTNSTKGSYIEDFELTHAKIRNLEHKCFDYEEEINALQAQSKEEKKEKKKLVQELASILNELSICETSERGKKFRKENIAKQKIRYEKLFHEQLNKFLGKFQHIQSNLTLKIERILSLLSQVEIGRTYVGNLQTKII